MSRAAVSTTYAIIWFSPFCLRQPIEEPLDGVVLKHLVEGLLPALGRIQKFLPDGGRDVLHFAGRHCRAARYGRMILATRSICANRMISAGATRRARTVS
jgi:hypothetical protein